MIKIFLVLFFVFGTIIGSFLNSVIFRTQKGESFLKGRSYCPKCKHTLSFFDLIPIFSFIFLKGRCRYCQERISWQYPLVEIATGMIFLFTFYNFQNSLNTFYNLFYFILVLVIFCFLILIFVYDLKTSLIPDKFLLTIIFLSLVLNFKKIFLNFSFKNTILIFLPALFLFLLYFFSKEKWLGFGDVEIALFMGAFLGWPDVILGLFLASFLGSIVGIFLIFLGEKTLKSQIPFGPFLVLGTFLTFFFGKNILNWYLNKILF
jgi:leader peptidase (prepilin peptidase)/N-methyltransferase